MKQKGRAWRRERCAAKLQQGAEWGAPELGDQPHPWLEFAGMFQGDPRIGNWKRSIEEYRQKVDDDPN
jgi:hypothetical protein